MIREIHYHADVALAARPRWFWTARGAVGDGGFRSLNYVLWKGTPGQRDSESPESQQSSSPSNFLVPSRVLEGRAQSAVGCNGALPVDRAVRLRSSFLVPVQGSWQAKKIHN